MHTTDTDQNQTIPGTHRSTGTGDTVAGDRISTHCISCNTDRIHRLAPLALPVDDPEYASHLIAECEACGLHSAYPLPTDEQLRRTYARMPHSAQVSSDSLIGKLWRSYRDSGRVRLLRSVARSGTVVDVGTGAGLFLRRAQEEGAWNLIGTDYSEVNVEELRADGIDARMGTLEGAGIEPGSVDVIWAAHVIEHMVDPPGFMETVRRYLKPGGALVAFVPSETSLRTRLGTSDWHLVNPPGHLWGFRPSTFRPIVERSGLQIERLSDSLLVCELVCVARNPG